eukprot:41045-Prorocentrum_minimum.AAC.1
MVSLLLDQTTPSRPVLGLWPYDPRSEILTIVGLAVHRCSKRTQYGSGYLLRALIVQRDTCSPGEGRVRDTYVTELTIGWGWRLQLREGQAECGRVPRLGGRLCGDRPPPREAEGQV